MVRATSEAAEDGVKPVATGAEAEGSMSVDWVTTMRSFQ
jgi:hypothetical protein